MDEKYRLVFRGEILEGHHKAVVKRRLREALQLDEPGMEKLFSGASIVVKRDADRTTAAQYQTLFKKAGGRLRVVAERPAAAAEPASVSRAQSATQSAVAQPSVNAAENDQPFSVDSNYLPPPESPAAPIEAPEFGLAAVGTDLVDAVETPPVIVPEPEFNLAEVGADILEERSQVAPVSLGPLNFEVAEVGSDIGMARPEDPVAVPDISHLKLVER